MTGFRLRNGTRRKHKSLNLESKTMVVHVLEGITIEIHNQRKNTQYIVAYLGANFETFKDDGQ